MLRELCLGLLVFVAAAGAGSARPLSVAASIGPVYALTAGVMGTNGHLDLLIPGGHSPHTFSLRPSTARAIAQADVVFRIAPNYEFALNEALALAEQTKVVDLINTPGLVLYFARDIDELEADQSQTGALISVDPHIWLDPTNARAMTAEIANVLAAIDAGNAQTYRSNANKLDQALGKLDASLTQELAPTRARPFIVFHDGYQYFERRYGLRFAGAVTETPGRIAGARHIHTLRQEVGSAGVRCIFTEPQFEPRLVQTVTEDLPVRVGVLDPLGAAEPPSERLYFTVMRNLAHSLRGCLGAP